MEEEVRGYSRHLSPRLWTVRPGDSRKVGVGKVNEDREADDHARILWGEDMGTGAQ
jgi:hypothetical protein